MPLKELAERRNILHRKSDAQTVLSHALDDVQIGVAGAQGTAIGSAVAIGAPIQGFHL